MITQLSHVGALVESTVKIQAGANVLLAFSIPGQNTPLTLSGTVLTTGVPDAEPGEASSPARTWYVEIQFTDLSSSDLARIRAWALQTMPLSSDRP
jgi:hypothetical protein